MMKWWVGSCSSLPHFLSRLPPIERQKPRKHGRSLMICWRNFRCKWQRWRFVIVAPISLSRSLSLSISPSPPPSSLTFQDWCGFFSLLFSLFSWSTARVYMSSGRELLRLKNDCHPCHRWEERKRKWIFSFFAVVFSNLDWDNLTRWVPSKVFSFGTPVANVWKKSLFRFQGAKITVKVLF